jgi:hypothetical protein
VGLGFVSPLRHDDSHLRHAHRVCRVRRVLGYVMPGSALWVARRVCDRHPHARHTQRPVWAGHRPVAQQRVSPCKRLANTSGPMGDAASALTHATDATVCLPQRGAPGNGCRPCVEADQFAVSTHRDQIGPLSPFPRRMARCRPNPLLRSFCNPEAGPNRTSHQRITPRPALGVVEQHDDSATEHQRERSLAACSSAGSGGGSFFLPTSSSVAVITNPFRPAPGERVRPEAPLDPQPQLRPRPRRCGR